MAQVGIMVGNQAGASLCTTGFQAVHAVYGEFTFTAGHCATVGLPSYQGGMMAINNGTWLMGTVTAKDRSP